MHIRSRQDLPCILHLSIMKPAKRTIEAFLHSFGRNGHRFDQCICMMSDRDRRYPFHSCLDHAPLILNSILLAVLIAQVNFQTRDPAAESLQRSTYHFLRPPLQFFPACDIIIGIDLDHHGSSIEI